MDSVVKKIQRIKIEIEETIEEQVSNFNYVGNLTSGEKNCINIELQRYNKMNGIIKSTFWKLYDN